VEEDKHNNCLLILFPSHYQWFCYPPLLLLFPLE
jgi:hypothetical protein